MPEEVSLRDHVDQRFDDMEKLLSGKVDAVNTHLAELREDRHIALKLSQQQTAANNERIGEVRMQVAWLSATVALLTSLVVSALIQALLL